MIKIDRDENSLELAELLFPLVNDTNDRAYYEGVRAELIESRNLSEGAEVTRVGPSPTGPMHIGTLYMSLISRRIADDKGGVFYLRIEDTDKAREVDGARKFIIDVLDQYGIGYDELYVQSERVAIYTAFAHDLVLRGLAYPCFMSSEDLDKMREEQTAMKVRPGVYGSYAKSRELSLADVKTKIISGERYVLRYRASGDVSVKERFIDEFLGEHNIPENDEDFILLKGDGVPTYHFAHVIDDYMLGTTFVTRGEEWLSSLGKHLALWRDLRVQAPKYGHIMPINKKENSSVRKLSKRKDREASMSYWQEMGYTRDAIVSYLLRLANPDLDLWWDKLVKSDEKIDIDSYKLDLSQMKRGSRGPLLDMDKLGNMSGDLIAQMSAIEVTEQILKWALVYDTELSDIIQRDRAYFERVINIERDTEKKRKDIAKWSDVRESVSYFYDEMYTDLNENKEERSRLRAVLEKVEYNDLFDLSLSIDEWISKMKTIHAESFGESVKFSEMMMILRKAVTGKEKTPNLYYVFEVLGKSKVISRL